MAAAEARAAWQRTANRCFVQEDAKRAPKLACCPPSSTSSSSSSKQVDSAPANATDGPEHTSLGFMPLKRNPSCSNLPCETRWWLHLQQPNYGYQKDLSYEQSNTLEAEVEVVRDDVIHSTYKNEEDSPNFESSINAHYKFSATCLKKESEIKKQGLQQELKAVYCGQNAQEFELKEDRKEYYELKEMDPVKFSALKVPEELCFDSKSPWVGAQRTEPWWRTADRDELASLVARKSLDHIDNCDLPRPQSKHVRRDPFYQPGYFDEHDVVAASSLEQRKSHTCSLPNPTIHAKGNLASVSPFGRRATSVEEGHFKCGLEKPPRTFDLDKDNYNTVHKEMTETRQTHSESDPSKAQLLEALRHSQTRAREAEKAAKQAYAEKEHIIKLFFRQASHLFAYKQWFQLLQLETLFIQLKNKEEQPVSTLFPVVLPWTPPNTARKLRKTWPKAAKVKAKKTTTTKTKQGKRGAHSRYDITKYAIAFALGLSLVGAGLLLGWTVGWMLPF